MRDGRDVWIERMADTGQWFEPGARVGYFPVEHDPRQRALESAALGPYEVVACWRVEVEQQRWLDVQLRRLFLA